MSARPQPPARSLLSAQGWPYLLVPFIPIAIVLELADAGAGAIFFAAALGIVPTAALMGVATEELAVRSGPGIGGLLNVTFGNAPELIIALFALGEGLHEVVKASIIGSIIGNILLVWGAVLVAYKNKMDLAVNIAIGSSAQVALFVAPVLVIASFVIGPGPLALVF